MKCRKDGILKSDKIENVAGQVLFECIHGRYYKLQATVLQAPAYLLAEFKFNINEIIFNMKNDRDQI
jgi:hypothetical protein